MAADAPFIGKKPGKLALDRGVFGEPFHGSLVHEAVRAELNSQRAGTRGAKTRGLVSGGRTKPWRQKGTGRARQGSIRAASRSRQRSRLRACSPSGAWPLRSSSSRTRTSRT